MTHLRYPSGPGIRNDGGLDGPADVPMYYDSLLSKLIAWGTDRRQAVARLDGALRHFEVEGVRTTLAFYRWLVAQDEFVQGAADTKWLDRVMAARGGRSFIEIDAGTATVAAIAVALATHMNATRMAERAEAHRAAADAWTLAARREALR